MPESLTELVKHTGSQNSSFGLESSGCRERPGWALHGAHHPLSEFAGACPSTPPTELLLAL